MPYKTLIALLYKHGERRQWTGNKADPTTVTTWKWTIKLPDNNERHFQIVVMWDVELQTAMNHKPWKRLIYGHETRLGALVQDIWGRLEDLHLKEHTYEDDDVIVGWR